MRKWFPKPPAANFLIEFPGIPAKQANDFILAWARNGFDLMLSIFCAGSRWGQKRWWVPVN
jgi:hypothetical protein